MSIFSWTKTEDTTGDSMTRAAKAKAHVNDGLVAEYIARLKASGIDRTKFSEVADAVAEDAQLTAANLIAIAVGYAGGKSPKSRAAAAELIQKRFVELVRQAGKLRNAEKARPW